MVVLVVDEAWAAIEPHLRRTSRVPGGEEVERGRDRRHRHDHRVEQPRLADAVVEIAALPE